MNKVKKEIFNLTKEEKEQFNLIKAKQLKYFSGKCYYERELEDVEEKIQEYTEELKKLDKELEKLLEIEKNKG